MPAYVHCPKCHKTVDRCKCNEPSAYKDIKKAVKDALLDIIKPKPGPERPKAVLFKRDILDKRKIPFFGIAISGSIISFICFLFTVLLVYFTAADNLLIKALAAIFFSSLVFFCARLVYIAAKAAKQKILCNNCGWLGVRSQLTAGVDGGKCPQCASRKALTWVKPDEEKKAIAKSLAAGEIHKNKLNDLRVDTGHKKWDKLATRRNINKYKESNRKS